MKLNIKLNKIIPLALLAGMLLISCESETPTQYIPQTYVEGFLLVGDPIEGIRLTETQPVGQKFNLEAAKIKDATVRISFDDQVLDLVYRDAEPWGYYYPDEEVSVASYKTYNLEIILSDGHTITASTHTPGPFDWDDPPLDFTYFPQDTIKQPPTDTISWTKQGFPFYLLSVKCLDTLEYGKYLETPTDEKNRKVFNALLNEEENYYKDVTSWNLISNTETPVVWFAFKWFGLNEITVYSPDQNYLLWFMKYVGFDGGSNEYDPNFASINGENAKGVFGSAYYIKKQTIIVKNQP